MDSMNIALWVEIDEVIKKQNGSLKHLIIGYGIAFYGKQVRVEME